MLLLVSTLLMGCNVSASKTSNANFKDVYEEVNDRNIPTNIDYTDDEGHYYIDNANYNEAVSFMKTLDKMINEKEIHRFSKSIEKKESNIPNVIEGKNYVASFTIIDDVYQILVTKNYKNKDN